MGLDIDIGIRNSRVRSGLAQIRSEVGKFSGSISGMIAGAFSIAGIEAFAGKMREVQKNALRFGTSAESIQRMGKAARESDVDFDMLAKSLGKVTIEAGKAARGSSEQAQMFKTLGIDAAKFVGMSLDDKVLTLSRAFKDAQGSGMKTSAMLDLLGERGTEIIPLLSRGPDALSKSMKEATVQTNATVKAFADLDRTVQKLKGIGARIFGTSIANLQKVSAFLSVQVHDKDYADAARSDLDSENMRRKHAGQAQISGREAQSFLANRKLELKRNAIREGMEDANKPDEVAPQAANDFTKDQGANSAESIKGLKKQITEDEDRNRADALTGEARIAELTKQRADLAGKINDTTAEGLEAKKRDLDLENEINGLKRSGAQATREGVYDEERNRADALTGEAKINELMRQRAELASQINDDTAEGVAAKKRDRDLEHEINEIKKGGTQRLREANQREADTLEKQYLDKASPKEKKAYLSDKQAKLYGEANALDDPRNAHYDPAKAVEKRTAGEAVQTEIDSMDKEEMRRRVSVPVDSLQRAGGGGRAAAMNDPAQRSRDKQTELLQRIADAVSKSQPPPDASTPEPY